MKKLNHMLFAGVIAATIGLAGSANAQFRVNEPDGIAASPRARQMLNEHKATGVTVLTTDTSSRVTPAGVGSAGADAIAASPKARQMMNERQSFIQRTGISK